MSKKKLISAFAAITEKIQTNQDYLIKLDQQNGDGDLGKSMSDGFTSALVSLETTDESDLGVLLNRAANTFNEAAPSTMGTIVAFLLKGMAKTLKGHEEADASMIGKALVCSVENVMSKLGSKLGEKTILDSIEPGARVFQANASKGFVVASRMAAVAAKNGSEATRDMRAVWGRAAYYGDSSIGVLDGGSVVGYLIFEALFEFFAEQE